MQEASLLDLADIRCGFNFAASEENPGGHGELCVEIERALVSKLRSAPAQIFPLYKHLYEHNPSQQEAHLAQFIKLIGHVLKQCWKPSSNRIEVEYALGSSPHFIELFKCIQLSGKPSRVVDDEWTRVLERIAGTLTTTCERIGHGEEIVRVIKFFNDHRDKLVLVFGGSKPELELMLAYRMAEIAAIESMRTSILAFAQFCMLFKRIDVKSYHQHRLAYGANIDDFALNSLCHPAKLDEIIKRMPPSSASSCPTVITCFEPVRNTDLELIARVNSLDRLRSSVLKSYVDECCLQTNKSSIGMRQVLDEIMPSALRKWTELGRLFESGEVRFGQIDELLQGVFERNVKRFLDEFGYICRKTFDKLEQTNIRLGQIKLYFKFKSGLNAVQLLNNIRQTYGLKGDSFYDLSLKYVKIDLLIQF